MSMMTQAPTNSDPNMLGADVNPSNIGQPTMAPALDPTQIDQRLQYLTTAEQSWGLPPLPANVKLDLASQSGLNSSSLGSFIQGLGSDINNALNPFAAQAASAAPLTGNITQDQFNQLPQAQQDSILAGSLPQQGITPSSVSGIDKLLAGAQGGAAPGMYDTNAVEYYKAKAQAYGFLPRGQQPDGTWDPALNFTAFAQVQSRDLQNRIAGDKPGGASYKTIFKLLDDYISPSSQAGALGSAVLHSFLPSFKDLGNFAHGWSNLFQHFTEGKAWAEAFKNSVPVIVPILTDALLVTGAGEVIGAARAGALGVDVAETASAAERAAAFGKAAEAAKGSTGFLGRLNPLGDVTQLRGAQIAARAGEPGFIGGKLLASDNTVLHGMGSAMQGWRDLGIGPLSVQNAKVAASGLTRSSLVAVAGAKLAPQGSAFYQDYRNIQRDINRSGMGTALNIAYVPLAPPVIFRPGTFLNLASPVTSVAQKFLTSTDGARMTWETARALNLNTTRDLVDHFGGVADGGQEAAQNFVTFIAHSAAADKDARALADATAGSEAINPTEWNQTYNNTRNAKLSNLAYLHPGDTETFIHVLRQKAGDGAADTALGLLTHPDPAIAQTYRDAMDTAIADHNAGRTVVSNNLLSTLKAGDVNDYVRTQVKNIDNWKNFLQANSDLHGWTVSDGILNAPAAFTTDIKTGLPVYKDVSSEPGLQGVRTAGLSPGDPGETLAKDLLQRVKEDPSIYRSSPLQPMARRVAVGDGRFALALRDTTSKQEAQELSLVIKNAKENLTNMGFLGRNPTLHAPMQEAFDILGQPIHDATLEDFQTALQAQFQGQKNADQIQKAGEYLRRLSANGEFDPAAMVQIGKNKTFQQLSAVKTQLDEQLKALNENADLWSRFGNVKMNSSIEEKADWLAKKTPFLAGTVAGVPQDLANAVDNAGYKLVHGANFLHPQDLHDLTEPFASVSKLQAHRMSLGTYLLPGQNLHVGGLIGQKTHSELVDTMHSLGMLNDQQAQELLDGKQGLPDKIIKGLYSYIADQQKVAQSHVDNAFAESGNWWAKLSANAESAKLPQGLRDLNTNKVQAAMRNAGLDDWATPKMSSLVRRAVLKGHDVGFQYKGLTSVEDKLRSLNPLIDNLLLGGTSSGQWLRDTVKSGGKVALVGAGVAGGEKALSGDLNPNHIIGAAMQGAGTAAALYGGSRLLMRAMPTMAKALPSLQDGNWLKYTFLPDDLAHLRNAFRFTLSPYFDMRRYTKGALIAQMVADHNDAQLPLLDGLKAISKDFGPQAVDEAKALHNAVFGNGYTTMEDTERFFAQRGILGYSPKEHQAATLYRLVQQGKSPEEAMNMVQKIYSYGRGRTPLEQSVNFMFFPFSFEKKVVGNAAKFLTDDFARTLLLHDGLKTYDTLNQHYNLSKELHDHLPLLPDLEKLNAFQHGINLGELGGINAPLLKIAPLLQANPLLHLFLPVGVKNPTDAQHVLARVVPAYNDIKRLTTDLEDQGHVIFGASHMTRGAEVNEAYAHWHDFMTNQVNPIVVKAGYTNYQAAAKADPALKQVVDNYKGHLMQKYPEWPKAIARTSAKTAETQAELTRDLTKTGPDYELLKLFNDAVTNVNDALKASGIHTTAITLSDQVDNASQTPAAIQQAVRNYAIWLAENSDDLAGGPQAGQFRSLYKKYYAKVWGPIERPA